MYWFHHLGSAFDKVKAVLSHPFAAWLEKNNSTLDSKDESLLRNEMLRADFGISATTNILKELKEKKFDTDATPIEKLKSVLQTQLPKESATTLSRSGHTKVILLVGMNGGGKTTTLAKLAYQLKQQSYSVLLAAGDTFRAAAVEQLKLWGTRINTPVFSGRIGSDAASVLFDAFNSARANQCDFLLADTAGRLNQKNLLHELQKIVRVMKRLDENAPHEIWAVLDATIGQNALKQVEWFQKSLGITGLVLTKLDGTAKGGILFALKHFQIPVRYLGFGEEIDALKTFSKENFIQTIF